MQRRYFFILLTLSFLFSGCASSQISCNAPFKTDNQITHPVNSIAMAPSGGILADAIAVELTNAGYQVFDSQQISQLFVRLNLDEFEIAKPQNMLLLKDKGIDVYLFVRSASGQDGLPQSAATRLNSTHTGKIITGVTWQNGWGGQAGSIADRTMRKDITEAAKEITDGLLSALPPPKR